VMINFHRRDYVRDHMPEHVRNVSKGHKRIWVDKPCFVARAGTRKDKERVSKAKINRRER